MGDSKEINKNNEKPEKSWADKLSAKARNNLFFRKKDVISTDNKQNKGNNVDESVQEQPSSSLKNVNTKETPENKIVGEVQKINNSTNRELKEIPGEKFVDMSWSELDSIQWDRHIFMSASEVKNIVYIWSKNGQDSAHRQKKLESEQNLELYQFAFEASILTHEKFKQQAEKGKITQIDQKFLKSSKNLLRCREEYRSALHALVLQSYNPDIHFTIQDKMISSIEEKWRRFERGNIQSHDDALEFHTHRLKRAALEY
jgi:hypothetical protein